MTYRTRFAPSPTGPLHLGHAYSAIIASERATAHGGEFLLRIEDIDQSRARPQWEVQIYEDLSWLGLSWPMPVLRQSDRLEVYNTALEQLWSRGLLYQCDCNRRDIQAAMSAPQEGAPLHGPDGLIYPGTCRHKHPRNGPVPRNVALRLDVELAASGLNGPLEFSETGASPGRQRVSLEPLPRSVGDIVLARRDMGTSYHLSVVLDDAAQEITEVVRGEDLFDATQIHVLLQRLLDLQLPDYHHHDLIRDKVGKRLAKRDDARAISLFRSEGHAPDDIRRMVGLTPSLAT